MSDIQLYNCLLAEKLRRENYGGKIMAGKVWGENDGGKMMAGKL
jgi:hypothetical protein